VLNQCGRVPFPPLTHVSDCVAVAVAVAVCIVPLPVNVTGEVTTDALSVDVEYTVPVGAAARPGANFHTNSSWRVDTQDAYDAMVAGLGYDLHVHPTVPEVARVMQNLTRTNASTLCKGVGLAVKATHMALAHPSTSPMLPFSGFSLNAVMRKTWVQQLESLALSTCQGHEAMTFQQLCVLANKVFGRDVCTTRKISPTKLLWGLNYTWVTSLKDMMRFDVGTYFADVPELPIGVQAEGSQTLNASASVELQLVVDFSEKSLVPRLTLETANMTFGADFNVHGDVRAWYVFRVAVSHTSHRLLIVSPTGLARCQSNSPKPAPSWAPLLQRSSPCLSTALCMRTTALAAPPTSNSRPAARCHPWMQCMPSPRSRRHTMTLPVPSTSPMWSSSWGVAATTSTCSPSSERRSHWRLETTPRWRRRRAQSLKLARCHRWRSMLASLERPRSSRSCRFLTRHTVSSM